MGCGNSKIVHDESSETVPPSKLGPLLRHQLENIRRRRSRVADAMTLKESTLSKKELLKDTGNAPYSLEDTSSSRLSASNKQDCEDDEDARNSLCSLPATVDDDDCKTLGRGKQPEEASTMSSKADDEKERQRLREEKVIAAVTEAIKQVYADEEETEAAKKEGDNNSDEDKDEDKADDDDGEMRAVGRSSLLQDDYSFPGSPSFRVYCMAPISADPENGIEEGELFFPPHHLCCYRFKNWGWIAALSGGRAGGRGKPAPVQSM